MNKTFYGATTINGWDVVYKKALEPDGSLLFPEKLTRSFLEKAQLTMGSYFFANQYLNEVIPSDKATFKYEWFQYYDSLPKNKFTFCIIDPALSEQVESDYTGVVIFDVDSDGVRYVHYAKRLRMTPTELVEFVFEVNRIYHPMTIGIEQVAYQKALLYFLEQEMRRRATTLPIAAVKPDVNKSKEARILGLVPWIEWGRMKFAQGLHDLELELTTFPRASHDDIIDALAYGDQISITPPKEDTNVKPTSQSSPEYERWYISQLGNKRRPGLEE